MNHSYKTIMPNVRRNVNNIFTVADEISERDGELVPVRSENKIPAIPYTKKRGITTSEELKHFIDRGFKCYGFMPAKRCGLIGLDVDNKNGRNGLQSLRDIGVDSNDLLKSTPHSQTPGKGLHLFFLYNDEPVLNNEILPGIEIKHSNLITVPESVDNRGRYQFTGSLLNCPPCPEWLLKRLKPKYPEISERRALPSDITKNVSLERMLPTLAKQGFTFQPGVNSNKSCHALAHWAAKNGHDREEVVRFVISRFVSSHLPPWAIKATVKSAYDWRERRG